MPIEIAQESPLQPDVRALLAQADAFSQALYPPESNHLVPADALAAESVAFFVARQDGVAVGTGALRWLADGAEVKRMFVADAARGLRVGRAMLEALETAALGARVLRLETGIYNHAALGLYRSAAFIETGPFADYGPDPLSVFMAKTLPE
jgi:putative acetyltransferase